ncbi:MAG: hypothetical protein JRL30_29480, partial [Deltaproteobacteria bacterium]|nr:hypothetical protein [Deltaproteobacteria bacterium]
FFVITPEEFAKLGNKVTDGLSPFAFTNKDGKVDSVQISGTLADYRDTIHDIISEIADNHGIAFSSRTTSAQKQSGLSLTIEKEALEDIKEEQLPEYRAAEDELSYKTSIILNTDLNAGIDLEGTFSIDFYEDREIDSVDDRIKWIDFLITKNFRSYIDIFREIDHDIDSKEEAEKRIKNNQEINQKYAGSLNFGTTETGAGEVDELDEVIIPTQAL